MGGNVQKNTKEIHNINNNMAYRLIILCFLIRESLQRSVANYEKAHQIVYFGVNTG